VSLFSEKIDLDVTLRFVEEKLHLGIWSHDVLTGCTELSPGAYELLGLRPDSQLNSWTEICDRIHPEDCRPAWQVFETLRGGLPVSEEVRVVKLDGRQRWILSQVEMVFDERSEPVKIQGVVMDITSHRETLQHFKSDAQRYEALMRVVDGVVLIARVDDRVSGVLNWKTSRPIGHGFGSAEEWFAMLHKDDKNVVEKKWIDSIKAGLSYDLEYRVSRSDGSYGWFRSRAAPIRNPYGAPQEWVGFVQEQFVASGTSAGELTGAQIRAARGILNWSVQELAEHTGVSRAVIRRLEEYAGTPPMADELLATIQRVLTNSGIEFVFSASGKPGVRPR
jgi:PAS domain S-box-containing protein